jgi:hypothetical protein
MPITQPQKGRPLRKFLFSRTFLSTVIGGWSILQATRKGPRDWRLLLLWVSWGASVAIAVSEVREKAAKASEIE